MPLLLLLLRFAVAEATAALAAAAAGASDAIGRVDDDNDDDAFVNDALAVTLSTAVICTTAVLSADWWKLALVSIQSAASDVVQTVAAYRLFQCLYQSSSARV